MWVYFWGLHFAPLVYESIFIPVPYSFDCYTFAVQFEIKKCDASSFVLAQERLFKVFCDFFAVSVENTITILKGILLTLQITLVVWAFFFLINLFIYLFIFGCVGSSFLCEGFLQLRRVGATLHRGVRASHCRGLSRCGAQAPDAQAQQLWLTGLVAPRHVGPSQTRARTHVPCIGRRIPNHCAAREALGILTILTLPISSEYLLIYFFLFQLFLSMSYNFQGTDLLPPQLNLFLSIYLILFLMLL